MCILYSVDNEEIPRCIQVFEQSVNSPVTRKGYRDRLDAFMEFCQITKYETLVTTDPKIIQTHLENYVIHLKRKHEKGDFRARSFTAYLAAIEAFFVQNDVSLNFKKVRKWIPKYEKLTGEEPYTTEDIKKIFWQFTLRIRALFNLAKPFEDVEISRSYFLIIVK